MSDAAIDAWLAQRFAVLTSDAERCRKSAVTYRECAARDLANAAKADVDAANAERAIADFAAVIAERKQAQS